MRKQKRKSKKVGRQRTPVRAKKVHHNYGSLNELNKNALITAKGQELLDQACRRQKSTQDLMDTLSQISREIKNDPLAIWHVFGKFADTYKKQSGSLSSDEFDLVHSHVLFARRIELAMDVIENVQDSNYSGMNMPALLKFISEIPTLFPQIKVDPNGGIFELGLEMARVYQTLKGDIRTACELLQE